MNAHGIVNGIVVFVVALLLIGQVIKKLGAAGAKTTAPAAPSTRHLELVEGQPRSPRVAAVPRQARDDIGRARDDMGLGFGAVDLTLPDVEVPAMLGVPRRAGRVFRGNALPGTAGWGANAVVAMEILGPPVSLRSGATLGAPHAF